MPLSLVQFTVVDVFTFSPQVNTVSVSFTSPVTAGNFVVFAGQVNNTDIPTLSNDKGDTITQSPLGFKPFDTQLWIAASLITTPGAQTYTATWTNNTPGRTVAIWEFSGMANPIWDTGSSMYARGGVGGPDSGTGATLLNPVEIAVGFMSTETNNVITTTGGGWTCDYNTGGNTNTNYNHQFTSVTTGLDLAGTVTGNANWTSMFATLQGSAGTPVSLTGQIWM